MSPTKNAKPHVPVPGAVYVTRLEDGRYVAVRVLRTRGRKDQVLSATTFLGAEPPRPEDPALRETVRRRRFTFEGMHALRWASGLPPDNAEFAFNVPVDEKEAAADPNSFGHWDSHSALDAFHEWRWQHERAAFEAEVAARREAARLEALKPQKPGRMLAAASFWELIGRLDWSRTGNDEAVMAPLVAGLAALPKAGIRGFHERLAHCLHLLDTREHARHIGEGSYVDADSAFSVDRFLYVRCAAVANGKAFFEAALANPACMPSGLEFEALLRAAPDAWDAKTGEDFDHETGCSFETFSNVAGWARP